MIKPILVTLTCSLSFLMASESMALKNPEQLSPLVGESKKIENTGDGFLSDRDILEASPKKRVKVALRKTPRKKRGRRRGFPGPERYALSAIEERALEQRTIEKRAIEKA